MVDHALRRHGVADHHRAAGAHDAGLLAPNALAVGAEEFDMVDVNTGDDRAIGVHDVGGVEPPAQPHLQNGHVEQRMAHQAQDGQRGELEVGQRNIVAVERARILHGRKMLQQRLGGDDVAMDAAALLEVHQVRRRIHPRAVARLQGDGLDHGAGRALAIGARHGDDGAVKAQRHAACHLAHPFQTHVDVVRVQAFAVRKPAFQGVNLRMHTARDCRPASACRMMAA